MLKKLDGLVGVVSGAGTEIGAAVARELGNAGMRLVLVGRGIEQLAEGSAGVGVGGGDLVAISAEASDTAAVDRAVGRAVERWGRLDVLVQDADVADVGPMVQAGPVLQGRDNDGCLTGGFCFEDPGFDRIRVTGISNINVPPHVFLLNIYCG